MAVYFIACDLVGLAKIGHAYDVDGRCRALQLQSAAPVRVAAFDQRGDLVTEAELHHRFREQRRHGEWFEMRGPVGETIDAVARTGCIPDAWYVGEIGKMINGRVPWHSLKAHFGITRAELDSGILATRSSDWGSIGIPPNCLPHLYDLLLRRIPDLTRDEFLKYCAQVEHDETRPRPAMRQPKRSPPPEIIHPPEKIPASEWPAMYEAGLAVGVIAKRAGQERSHVRRVLIEAGVEMRKLGRPHGVQDPHTRKALS